MGPRTTRSRDDDVDDFMASLMTDEPATPAKRPGLRRTFQKQPKAESESKPLQRPEPKQSAPKTQPRRNPARPKKGIWRPVLTLVVVAGIIASGIFLWNGPVSSLLEPRSPFSAEAQEKMGIPLYFPTKMPGTFKIETESITQPESGVVIYAVTDDDGKRINITLQKQPDGLSLDPLYAVLQDAQDVDTKFGSVKIGTSSDNITVANVLTDETWVIINSADGSLTPDVLQTLVNSFKQ